MFEQCPEHWLAQARVIQCGWGPALVLAGNALTEDHRDLVRTAEFATGAQELVMKSIQNSLSPKNQVVTQFHLPEIKAIFAAQIMAFVGAEKGTRWSIHFLPHALRSWAVSASAIFCKALGSQQATKELSRCCTSIPCCRNRSTIQSCWSGQSRAENGK